MVSSDRNESLVHLSSCVLVIIILFPSFSTAFLLLALDNHPLFRFVIMNLDFCNFLTLEPFCKQ